MGQTQHIFLVDDHNPEDLQVMMFALENANSNGENDRLYDGAQVLDYLQERARFEFRRPKKFASVLLDIKVPKTSGRAILKQLVASKKLKDIPIILITSSKEVVLAGGEELGKRAIVLDTDGLKEYQEAIEQLGVAWVERDRPN